ncbi:hypothetical protein V2J09_007067 [Rumex salicifolius]
MATFSSISTKISPLLPCNFEFIDEQKKLLNFQEGFVDASSSDPFPILVFAPLPCRSAVQSKRGIAQSSNGKKRETIEMIVGSCISRAVAFSSHQFRTVLKSFSDLALLLEMSATVARALMEPAVVDAMLQAMLMPFQAIFFILMSPEFGNQIVQFMMVVFAVGPLIAIVLLWLIWRWWRAKKAQGIDADDGEGHKQDDGDRE